MKKVSDSTAMVLINFDNGGKCEQAALLTTRSQFHQDINCQ